MLLLFVLPLFGESALLARWSATKEGHELAGRVNRQNLFGEL